MQNWKEQSDQKLSRREMLEQWKRNREKLETPKKSLSIVPKPPKFEEVLRTYEPKLTKTENSPYTKGTPMKASIPPSTSNVRRKNSEINAEMVVKDKIEAQKGKLNTQIPSRAQSCKKFTPQHSAQTKLAQSVRKQDYSDKVRGDKTQKKIMLRDYELQKERTKPTGNNRSLDGCDLINKQSDENLSNSMPQDLIKEPLLPKESDNLVTSEISIKEDSPKVELNLVATTTTTDIQIEDQKKTYTQSSAESINEYESVGNQSEQSESFVNGQMVNLTTPTSIEETKIETADDNISSEKENIVVDGITEAQEKIDPQSVAQASKNKKKVSKKRLSKYIEDEKDEDSLLSHRSALKKTLLEKDMDEAHSQGLKEKLVKIEYGTEVKKPSVKKKITNIINLEENQTEKYGLEMALLVVEFKKGKNNFEERVTTVRRSKRLNAAKTPSKTSLK